MQPLLGVSLKMYMGAEQTRAWVRSVRDIVDGEGAELNVDVFILPSFPLVDSVSQILAGSRVHWGAQDLAADGAGAQTGEVSGSMLAEMGCRYVEVGHAERRRMFAETEEVVAAKAAQAFAHGLVPIICIGETTRTSSADAARVCIEQLTSALAGDRGHDIVVAYEPVWAIGADQPADPSHVRQVCRELRSHLTSRTGRGSILYGGSAGPGTYSHLGSAVDGLFLGRFAHDPTRFASVLREIGDRSRAELTTR